MQMPPKIISKDNLFVEIESVFKLIEMPNADELTFHKVHCAECDDLREELLLCRGKSITGETIRLIHQELSLLSAKAWRWILPHYLKYCLTPEAEFNQMETQFLIYNLGADIQFQAELSQRLSLLNKDQILCLIHFLEWCSDQEYWQEFCPDSISRGINFLKHLARNQEESDLDTRQ